MRACRILSIALLFLVVACGETKESAPAANALVTDLYKSQSPFFQTENRALVDKYFEPALATLIWNDAVAADGEVGAIDFDPLYGGQDFEVKNLVVGPAQNGRVVVSFDNFGRKEQVIYSLTAEGKISDIRYGDGLSLRGILTQNSQA